MKKKRCCKKNSLKPNFYNFVKVHVELLQYVCSQPARSVDLFIYTHSLSNVRDLHFQVYG